MTDDKKVTWREVLYGTEESRANRPKTRVMDMVKGVFAIAFAVSIIFSAVHLATSGSHHKAPSSVHDMFAKEDAQIQARIDAMRARARAQEANTKPCLTLDENGKTESFFGEC